MMDNLIHTLQNFLTSHPYLGWIIAAFVTLAAILARLSSTVSSFQVLKANILLPFAKRLQHRKLVKAAIKNDVEGHINKVLDHIRNELPVGWASPANIKWVQEENKKTFISENQVVMRIRPLEAEDENFARTLYLYFKNSFFPKTQASFPQVHAEAVTMQFCKRVIHDGKPSAEEYFDDNILEPAIAKKKNLIDIIEKLDRIDKKGLFTGVFIREIHTIAQKIRLTSQRKDLGSEFSGVLAHLEEFSSQLGVNDIPDYQWTRQGTVEAYALLLVARPSVAASGAVTGYVNRAKQKAEKKITNLYVFGTSTEDEFAKEVIKCIKEQVMEYAFIEEFDLHKDYRGEKGGRGAWFTLK